MDRKQFLLINNKDNVGVALNDIYPGEEIKEYIGQGHKFALKAVKKGEKIIKYGYPIGSALCDIEPGSLVHTHNIKSDLDTAVDFKYIGKNELIPDRSISDMCFSGYRRQKYGVGIRNEIWIINTVGCVNKTAEIIARKANEKYYFKNCGFDGIHTFSHPYGCSQLGEDHTNTQRILSSLCKHPNAAGVLILGLGCENNNINEFSGFIDKNDPRYRFLQTQDVKDEIEEGVKLIGELTEYAGTFKRQSCPVSDLKIGFKCGGSDAFSGITANPLCGKISDLLTGAGATCVLTEVPEMFGAEEILLARAKNQDVFDRIVGMINGFKNYFIEHGQVVYENPSPGNKDGGISTLEEKSLGNVLKGGTGVVTDVIDYGSSADVPGLVLLNGPGNDAVSSTALAAAGVHMIIFTTGRGTPFGTVVPVIKVSSNSDLYEKKRNWIDFNAGSMIEGASFNKCSEQLLEKIISTACGEMLTKNEINDYREIAIFKNGVTL